MKQVLLIAGYLILIGSCKKEHQTEPSVEGEQKISINKFTLTQYDNVDMEASVEGLAENDITLRGFCWSLSPERTVSDSLYKIYQNEPFRAHVNSLGQNSRIYVRAFVETYKETYFSDSIVLNTSGLQLLWSREYGGPKQRVKQVINSGHDGFLALVERMDGPRSWPGLMKIDTSGHIIWDRAYYANDIKTPQYLLPVTDGYLIATTQGLQGTGGILVFKTDLNGMKLWEQIFTKQSHDNFVRMTVLPNQTVQLTTRSYGIVNDKRVNVLVDDYLFNGAGQVLNSISVPINNSFSTSRDPIKTLTTADGGFVSVSETTASLNSGVVVNKFNDAYQMVWDQFCLRATGQAVSVSLNAAGNYMVRGVQTSNAVVMEIDKNNGELLWQYDFDLWKYETAFGEGALAVSNDGYYVAAEGKLFLKPGVHGPLLIKLGTHGEFLYDYMHVDADLHYTDAVLTNANKEIYLFGTGLKQLSDKTGKLFIIKLKER